MAACSPHNSESKETENSGEQVNEISLEILDSPALLLSPATNDTSVDSSADFDQEKPPEEVVKDLSYEGLETLLQEAISYKHPQDRQGKSKLFQALLTKAEESDSGEDKLFIQNLRNKPKKTEGKKKRRKESGSSSGVSVAARGTGGGSLQDLAAAPPNCRASHPGARARAAKHSQGANCDEDGSGVAGRTREGGSCGNLSKGSFQTSAPSERKKRRRGRDGTGRQPNRSGSLENLTQTQPDQHHAVSGGHTGRKNRKNRRDGRSEGGLNRSGSLQDILKPIESTSTSAKKKKKKDSQKSQSVKHGGSLQDLTKAEQLDKKPQDTSKRRLKKSGSTGFMEIGYAELRDDVGVAGVDVGSPGCEVTRAEVQSVSICIGEDFDIDCGDPPVPDDDVDVEMQDVSGYVPHCRTLTSEEHKLFSYHGSYGSMRSTDGEKPIGSRIAEGNANDTKHFLPCDSDAHSGEMGLESPPGHQRNGDEPMSNLELLSSKNRKNDEDPADIFGENGELDWNAMYTAISKPPNAGAVANISGVLNNNPRGHPFSVSDCFLNKDQRFLGTVQALHGSGSLAAEKKKKRKVNGEKNVKTETKAEEIAGHVAFTKIEDWMAYLGEDGNANGTRVSEINGSKARGRSDKRKNNTGQDVTNLKSRNKRDRSVNVNGKSNSSGSEVSSDVGCQSPDSAAKDDSQSHGTPSEAGSVDGALPVLKRSSSHGELREEVSKADSFRKQSTLDSGLGLIKGNANTYHSEGPKLSVEDDKDSFKEDFYSVTTLASNDAVPCMEDRGFQTVTSKKNRKKTVVHSPAPAPVAYKKNFKTLSGSRPYGTNSYQPVEYRPVVKVEPVPVQPDEKVTTEETSPTPSTSSRRRRKGTNSSSGVGTSKTSTSMPSSDVSDDSSDVESVQSLPAHSTTPRPAEPVKCVSSFASYADIAKANSAKPAVASGPLSVQVPCSPTPDEKEKTEEMDYPPLPGAPSAITPAKPAPKKSPSPASKDSVIKRRPTAVVSMPLSMSTSNPSSSLPSSSSCTSTQGQGQVHGQSQGHGLGSAVTPPDDRPAVIMVGLDGKSEAFDLSRPLFAGGISFGFGLDNILTGCCEETAGTVCVSVPEEAKEEEEREEDVSAQVQPKNFAFTDLYRDIGDSSTDETYNFESVREFMHRAWQDVEKKMKAERKKDASQRTVKSYQV